MVNAEQYIGIPDGVMMYFTKQKCNILLEYEKQQISCFKFFAVNESGQKIIESIEGNTTVNDLITDYCNSEEISVTDNEQWIMEFIDLLSEKEVVVFDNKPLKQKELKVVGDGNIISPMLATIEITETCNLKCKHCYLDASCKKTSHITYEQFEDLVKVLKKNKVVNLELTGGEIFVNPDAYKILELSLRNFALVGILTNGTIMDDKILSLLKENKDRIVVNVSIDSINPELHDEFRGMKGAFERSCNTIKQLTDAGILVRMASSIFKENMWEVDQLADLALMLGAQAFSFSIVEDFGRGKNFDGEKTDQSIDPTKYVEYVNNTVNKYRDIIPVINTEERAAGTNNCGSGVNSIIIGANGDLRPCALFPKSKLFGNIFEEKFEEIFKKDIYETISGVVPPLKSTGCEGCRYITRCSGCYLKGLESNRNKEEEDYCNWVKQNKLEKVVQIYERGMTDV